ncbi:hypothetical protein ACFODZ_00520 [Marinicella sediminis]|uniref:Peptidase C39-like domain-containing protein n=1 Tax=Marinicella sediminis TaxID=1792834 RepID=A0ABV7J3K5_9GAMM|nr:hypothetical protein [Marinicella sediminis]
MNKLMSFLLMALSLSVHAQERHTSFDPNEHGFNFENTFTNDFVSELDWRTNGLCGGMVYAALDYYLAGKKIPSQDYRPAVNSQLHDYIYDRQVHSIADNVDKWAELGFNPGGARNSEFFKWGLEGKRGGRIDELRSSIDRGIPVPLGLFHADDHRGGDHQVLAIGYKMGRYRGDLGAHQTDFEIHVYDPNKKNAKRILKANPQTENWYYIDDREKRWQSYFVDKKYRRHSPPTIEENRVHTDGKIRTLRVHITTGGDDLRGGNDNVDIEVGVFGQSPQRFNNVNNSRRWIDHYTQTVELNLRQAVERSEISHIKLMTAFGGGMSGDNWKVNKVQVQAIEYGRAVDMKAVEGQPWYEFKGGRHSKQIDLNYRSATTVNTTIPPIVRPVGNRCHNSLQNKVAWDYKGNKRWGTANMDRLCGTTNSDQPAKCFNKVMHGNVNWGGGTQWQWENALKLCQGTLNANRTVVCFKKKIKEGSNWSSAISACKR